MIQDNTITFLELLQQNNNKEWFTEHKQKYLQAYGEFNDFLDHLIEQMAITDESLSSLTSKDCVYRIYRDVRFSKDKTPYKTHFGANIAAGGRKSKGAGFYVHLEPGGKSISGGGIYMPESAILKAIRKEFYQVPEELIEILENPSFKEYFHSLWGDKLKLAPKGFPKDFEHIDLLKYKSYVVIHEMKDSIIRDKNFVNYLVEVHKQIYPLIKLLNTIIEDAELH